jgi:hypothetical protein
MKKKMNKVAMRLLALPCDSNNTTKVIRSFHEAKAFSRSSAQYISCFSCNLNITMRLLNPFHTIIPCNIHFNTGAIPVLRMCHSLRIARLKFCMNFSSLPACSTSQPFSLRSYYLIIEIMKPHCAILS